MFFFCCECKQGTRKLSSKVKTNIFIHRISLLGIDDNDDQMNAGRGSTLDAKQHIFDFAVFSLEFPEHVHVSLRNSNGEGKEYR